MVSTVVDYFNRNNSDCWQLANFTHYLDYRWHIFANRSLVGLFFNSLPQSFCQIHSLSAKQNPYVTVEAEIDYK